MARFIHKAVFMQPVLDVPADAQLLTALDQYGHVTVWYTTDPDTHKNNHTRTIEIAGTGHPVPLHLPHYVATVILGSFVWHVFDSVPRAT